MRKTNEISKSSLKRRWGNIILGMACAKCSVLFLFSLWYLVPGHDSATWVIGFEFFVGLLLLGMNMYQAIKQREDSK
jgi:hypothetical protein